MQTSTYSEVEADTRVEGSILIVGTDARREMYLTVGEGSSRNTFHVVDPIFLDRLSNEAERLCREFVGDIPPLEPLPPAVALHGGPEIA